MSPNIAKEQLCFTINKRTILKIICKCKSYTNGMTDAAMLKGQCMVRPTDGQQTDPLENDTSVIKQRPPKRGHFI